MFTVAAYPRKATPLQLSALLRYFSAFLCDPLPLRLSAAPRLAKRLLCQSSCRSSGLFHRATSRGDTIPWQYIVFLGFSMHPSAIPSHRKSPQCITIAGQRDTVHFNAFAQRSASTQSRSFAARYPSSPFPCVSQHRLPVVPILCLAMPLFAVPLLCKSPRFYAHLSLCQASPRQADLYHRVSSRIRASPLRSQAKRGFTFALHISAILCLCWTVRLVAVPSLCLPMRILATPSLRNPFPCLCFTLPFSALPLQCFSVQGQAIPLRYAISSQRNRPFPLFRHWPMPENRP